MTTIPNFPKGWTTEVETALIDFVEEHPELWKLMRFSEVTDEHKQVFAIIQPILNNQFKKEYTVDMVAQKWCELSLLFDLKFAINGYTMKPRTNVYYKDGRIKDDLAEYWVHFPRIGAFMGDKPEVKDEFDDEEEEVDIKPDVSKLKMKFKK